MCDNECVNGICSAPNVCECNAGYALDSDGFTCLPQCSQNCEAGNAYCDNFDVCVCHPGFKEIPEENKSDSLQNQICEYVCSKPCVHGVCVAPDICECKEGYYLDEDDIFTCKPQCDEPCVNGNCTAPNVCTCNPNYKEISSHECELECDPPCENGKCVEEVADATSMICQCSDGYERGSDNYSCVPKCDNCENGACVAPNECVCNDEYYVDPDSQTCLPRCYQDCEANNAYCAAPDVCECNPGYKEIPEDDRYDSQICELCKQPCINGICGDLDTCVCEPGYSLSEDDIYTCKPQCDFPCINGNCTAPNECSCNPNYKQKSFYECMPECDPPCENGQCVEEITDGVTSMVCQCSDGYERVGENICEPICSQECIHGDCTAPETCTCHKNYQKKKENNSENFDTSTEMNFVIPESSDQYNYICEPICHSFCKNGKCTAPNVCEECEDGYTLLKGRRHTSCIIDE